MYNHNWEQNPRKLNAGNLELNAKQTCGLVFIVSDKVYFVAIIASNLSGVIILIGINL